MCSVPRRILFITIATLLAADIAVAQRTMVTWKPVTEGEAAKLLVQNVDLRNNQQDGTDPWARTFQEMIGLGEAAVPDLCTELDHLTAEDRYMLRMIPFVLRGIGDKRAVPSLIRAFPLAFGQDGSDMGYRCGDPELLAFMLKHDDSPQDSDDDDNYNFGRPINEMRTALQRLTGQSFGEDGLCFVSLDKRKGVKRNNLSRQLYFRTASKWANWWNENSEMLIDDPMYRKVELVSLTLEQIVDTAPDREGVWSDMEQESSGSICSSIESQGGYEIKQCLFDIDTNRRSELPPHLAKGDASSRLGDIVDWAAQEGFDLMGDQYGTGEEAVYILRPVKLKVWEVTTDWKKSPNKSFSQLAAAGREVEGPLVHINEAGEEVADQPATFLFETNEGTIGLLDVGVSIKTRWTRGMRNRARASDNELDPVGVMLGRRFGIRHPLP